jgi:hypothetical protein
VVFAGVVMAGGVVGAPAQAADPNLDNGATAMAPARREGPSAGATSGWWQYRIAPGAHSADQLPGSTGDKPLAGFTSTSLRSYRLAFDQSAEYVLTNPTQVGDQFDWNKLPGVSDCGVLDLSDYGAMFGWRWRIDVVPNRLEVTAYWNVAGAHLTPPEPLFSLSDAELASGDPLSYSITIEPDRYVFGVDGVIEGRVIAVRHVAERGCRTSTTDVKWASGLYFGGTSVAPNVVTAAVAEP